MKKISLLLFLSLYTIVLKAQYNSQNINLLGHWYNPAQIAEPAYGIKYNSVWGWVNPKTKVEYGILGSGSGTSIIDLSDPYHPKEVDFVPGRRNKCIWREYKTYKNYLYAVSDDGSPNSFQIIDLSPLPDSVHVVYDGTDIFERSHTIFIDGDKLYAGSVKQDAAHNNVQYSMGIYSLTNPEKPVFLRSLNQDDAARSSVHDMYVKNDTVYASCGYDGLFIYLYDAAGNKLKLINAIEFYAGKGYNHSSALTKNSKTFVFCDEVPSNLPVKVTDVSDINNIAKADTFKTNPGATPHNPYIKDNAHVLIAYYQDGLQIYDISNSKLPVRTGYFDTDTIAGAPKKYDVTGTAYHGCWGAYVDLPSGIILASDMQNGLFVLNANAALGINSHSNISISPVTIYPNPTSTNVTLQFQLRTAAPLLFEVLDMTGRKLFSKTENEGAGSITETIDMSAFDKGMYLIRISGKDISYSSKLLKN
jgi:choice-of-anchor B domain-containing protein